MNRFGASLIALCVAGSPVAAEIDAATLLSEWEAVGADAGGVTVEAASRVETDTSVQMRDVRIAIESTRESWVLEVAALDMVETPAGAVEMTLSGPARVSFTNPRDPSADNSSADLILGDVRLTVSDTDGLQYQLTSSMIGLENGQITVDGQQINASLAVSIANFGALFNDSGDAARERALEIAVSSDAVSIAADASIPEEGLELFDLRIELAQMRAVFDGVAPMAALFGFSEPGDLVSVVSSGLLDDVSVAFAFREGSGDGRRSNAALVSGSLDRFEFDLSGLTPPDLEAVFEGRAPYPEQINFDIGYTLAGLTGRFEYDERYEFTEGEPSVSRVVFDLDETSSDVRATLDDRGMLSVSAAVAGGFGLETEETDVSSDTSFESQVDGELRGASYSLDLSVPVKAIADNPMVFMQGIPDGLRYQIAYEIDTAAFGFLDGYQSNSGDGWGYRDDISFAVQGLDAAADFSADGVNARLRVASGDWDYADDEGQTYAVDVSDVIYSLVLPLRVGGEPERYALEMGFSDLTLNDTIWNEADPQAVLARDPINLSFLAEGLSTVRPNWFAAVTMQAGVPFDVSSLVFQLSADGFGATLAGNGDFDPSDSLANGTAPVGTASFVGTGLEELLEGARALEMFPPSDLDEMAFFFEVFTEAQPDGTRVLDIEVTEQQHLIINGQRMQ